MSLDSTQFLNKIEDNWQQFVDSINQELNKLQAHHAEITSKIEQIEKIKAVLACSHDEIEKLLNYRGTIIGVNANFESQLDILTSFQDLTNLDNRSAIDFFDKFLASFRDETKNIISTLDDLKKEKIQIEDRINELQSFQHDIAHDIYNMPLVEKFLNQSLNSDEAKNAVYLYPLNRRLSSSDDVKIFTNYKEQVNDVEYSKNNGDTLLQDTSVDAIQSSNDNCDLVQRKFYDEVMEYHDLIIKYGKMISEAEEIYYENGDGNIYIDPYYDEITRKIIQIKSNCEAYLNTARKSGWTNPELCKKFSYNLTKLKGYLIIFNKLYEQVDGIHELFDYSSKKSSRSHV